MWLFSRHKCSKVSVATKRWKRKIDLGNGCNSSNHIDSCNVISKFTLMSKGKVIFLFQFTQGLSVDVCVCVWHKHKCNTDKNLRIFHSQLSLSTLSITIFPSNCVPPSRSSCTNCCLELTLSNKRRLSRCLIFVNRLVQQWGKTRTLRRRMKMKMNFEEVTLVTWMMN